MENATKALLMVAGVLIGVMILSLGIFLYTSLGGYVNDTKERMDLNATNQFNVQFTKYINMVEDATGNITYNGKKYKQDFDLTIQDVITAANLAHQNNIENNLTIADAGQSSLYVKVNAWIHNGTSGAITNGIESDINDNAATYLANEENQKHKYQCISTDVKFSETTGRVIEITFR